MYALCLTRILLEPKVNSILPQVSSQVSQLQFLILIFLKTIKGNSYNGMWIILFQKFDRLMVNLFTNKMLHLKYSYENMTQQCEVEKSVHQYYGSVILTNKCEIYFRFSIFLDAFLMHRVLFYSNADERQYRSTFFFHTTFFYLSADKANAIYQRNLSTMYYTELHYVYLSLLLLLSMKCDVCVGLFLDQNFPVK